MKNFHKVISAITVVAIFTSNILIINAAEAIEQGGMQFKAVLHQAKSAEVILSQDVSEKDGYLVGTNVSAYVGEAASVTIEEQSDRLAWEIGYTENHSNEFIYLNIDDFYLQNKNLALICEIDYLDVGNGSFLIQYDKYNANFAQDKYANSSTITLQNTGEWKTASILIENAYIMNRQAIKGAPAQDVPFKRSADLRLRALQGNMSISAIRIREGVEVTGISEAVGNIFTTQDEKFLPLKIYNSTGEVQEFTVICDIKNEYDETIHSYNQVLELANNSAAQAKVALNVQNKGVYTATVTVNDSNNTQWVQEAIPFSVVSPKNGTISENAYFGVQTHLVRKIFAENTYAVDDLLHVAELAGAQVMRDEMYWGMAEPEKDNFVFLPHWDQYVDVSIKNGIQPSLILSYGNEKYRDTDEQGTPTPGTDTQIAAFANYARQMATHYKGKIKQYEVWNEWNGGMNNRPSDTATGRKYESDVYTRLMKATYEAIKSVDPDAAVVGCVSAGANSFYIESVIAAGGLNYMDAVSFHPYNYPSVPDRMATEASTFEGIRKLNSLMKRYGEEKPLIISEQGWPGFTANQATNVAVPEHYQATYISRLFTLGLAYGAQQVIVYDLQDDGTYGVREQNFGLIEHWRGDEVPFAAKPSLVAMNAITEFLQNVEFKEEYVINQDLRAYKFFRKADNKDVVVLWGVYHGHKLKLLGQTASMQGYDMYGNECDNTFVGTDPLFFVGNADTFDINEVITDRWYSVNADASHNIPNMEAANGTYYYDSYLSSAPWYEGIKLNTSGGLGAPEFIVRGTRKGWSLRQDKSYDHTIFADIDSSYMLKQEAMVKVRVEYFDEGNGEFYVWYDSVAGETLAGTVSTTGSKQWKEATFILPDAYFGNRLEGADIKISIKNNTTFGLNHLVFGRVEAEKMTVSTDFSSEKGLLLTNKTDFSMRENIQNRTALVLNNVAKAKFDVDDKFIFGGETNVKLSVEYFDASYDNGESFFAITYDENKKIGKISLQGDNTWKQANIIIPSAVFTNLCEGADFLISTSYNEETSSDEVLLGAVKVERISPSSGKVVAGKEVTTSYLEPMPSGNAGFASTPSYYSNTAQKEIGTMRTNKAQSSPNLFVLVSDDYLYDVDVTAELTITFWDEGSGNLLINYDGVKGKNIAKNVASAFTNSKDFKTVTVELPEARFYSRGAQKSDIQISRSIGDIAVAEISLQVPDLKKSFIDDLEVRLPATSLEVDIPSSKEIILQNNDEEKELKDIIVDDENKTEDKTILEKAINNVEPTEAIETSQLVSNLKANIEGHSAQLLESNNKSLDNNPLAAEGDNPTKTPEGAPPAADVDDPTKTPEGDPPTADGDDPTKTPEGDPPAEGGNNDESAMLKSTRNLHTPLGCEITFITDNVLTGPTIRNISDIVTMDTTAPLPVSGLQARAVDAGVFISWTNPEDGFANAATTGELRVYIEEEDGRSRLLNYKMDSPANNPEGKNGLFYVGGLENGKEYKFIVTATDKWLNESTQQYVSATPTKGSVKASDLTLIENEQNISTVSVNVENNSSSAEYRILMIAAYTKDNKMQKLFTKPILFMNDTQKHTLSFSAYTQDLKDVVKIKAFLWDDMNEMVPILNFVELNNK